MPTLLLRTKGKQSWGTDEAGKFERRTTRLEPSKSGIIGLVCCCMGVPRDADITLLANLKMGVRADREGVMEKDFQIAKGFMLADGKTDDERNVVSHRFYLADADFLVGLEGSREVLERIERGLTDPVWPPFLGRKAFPPSVPVWLPDGLVEADMPTALAEYPWLGEGEPPESLRMVIESKDGEDMRFDQPLSFASRDFTVRYVVTQFLTDIKVREEDDVPI